MSDINAKPAKSGTAIDSVVELNGMLYFTTHAPGYGSELWKSDGTAQGTVRVNNLLAGDAGSDPSDLLSVYGSVYFIAGGAQSGRRLWRTDGTADGTVMVETLVPGGMHDPSSLTACNGTVFFVAWNAASGKELWKTDGTPDGTVLVKDISPGDGWSSPFSLRQVNGVLYFGASDGVGGALWKSDGTAGGTVKVTDKTITPDGLINVDGTLYFPGRDSASGTELWKSDGTPQGTVMVKDICPGSESSWVYEITSYKGALFFMASDGVSGMELWTSDGTGAGTVMLKDINPGSQSSSPSRFVEVNGALYFSASSDISGNELWKTDGTAAATVMVADICPGSGSSEPINLLNVSGELVFQAKSNGWTYALWKSDGTPGGTKAISNAGLGDNPSYGFVMVNVNGTIFFRSSSYYSSCELWKSDRTAAGTVKVKAIYQDSEDSRPTQLVSLNNVLFFRADDGVHGAELWKSDGTLQGTAMVKDICAQAVGSDPSNLTKVGGTLFFAAKMGFSSDVELFKSDGSAEGTLLVKDIYPGTSSSNPSELLDIDGTVYFAADDGVSGRGLWKSDGTRDGTVIVRSFSSGVTSGPFNFASIAGKLMFWQRDGSAYRLWASDGTSAGTVVLAEQLYYGSPAVSVNGKTFFTASDGTTGYKLWTTDGTAAGTMVATDVFAGTLRGGRGSLVSVNGMLLFQADKQGVGSGVWKSDGTGSGTTLLKNISLGEELPVVMNGAVYFQGLDGFSDGELWKTDGTPEGTVRVKDIWPGQFGSDPAELVSYNGTLYFVATGSSGREVWKSDGTEEGTMLAFELFPGFGSSNPTDLTLSGGRLFLSALAPGVGVELFAIAAGAAPTVAPGNRSAVVSVSVPGSTSSTSTWIEYSEDTTFGLHTPSQTVRVNTPQTLAFALTGLKAGTIYHYRAVTFEGAGIYSEVGTFRTKPEAPLIQSSAAVAVLDTVSTIATRVVSNGELTNAHVEYSVDGSFSLSTPSQSIGGSVATTLLFALPGLQPDTLYRYRVVAANQVGSAAYEGSFTTSPALTLKSRAGSAAISVAPTGSNASVSVRVEYGTSAAFGMSTEAQSIGETGSKALSFALSGLQPGTLYYCRVVATSSIGTTYGEVQSFTTLDVASVVVVSGGGAPGAGDPNGTAAGTVIRGFGVPAISNSGRLAAKVTLASGRKLLSGIFLQEVSGGSALPAVQAGRVPGVNATYQSFLDPQLSPGGALAFGAKIKGEGISATNDEGLWTDAFGRGLEPVLREGGEIPALSGARLKAISSISLRDHELLALVTLAPAKGIVTSHTDSALLRITDGGVTVLLREGTPLVVGTLPASNITQISALAPAAASQGHGRWQADSGEGVAKLTLANKLQVVVRWTKEGDIVPILSTVSATDNALPGSPLVKLGLPSIGVDGAGVVAAGQLKVGPGAATKSNDSVVIYRASDDLPEVVAREALDAPGLAGVTFADFLDPVMGSAGEFAFIAKLKGNGIQSANQSSLWWGDAASLEMVAQQGGPATDETGATVPGRKWKSFISHALPSGPAAGPIFVAQVSGAGIRADNNLGLWAVDTQGLVRELIRTGAPVESANGTKTLRSFTLLTALKGSFSVSRSFNSAGSIGILGTFDDKSQALIRLDIP